MQQYGISKHQIDSITPTLKFINDWAYLNVTDELMSSLSSVKLKKMDDERRINKQIETIKASPVWYEAIKKKAIGKGMTEEDMLKEDAAFVLHIFLPAIPKTLKEKISEKIIEIKANPSWLKSIEEKAIKLGVSTDSALYDDAKWTIEQESK